MSTYIKIFLPALIIALVVFSSISSVYAEINTGAFAQTSGTAPEVEMQCSWRSPTTWFQGCLILGFANMLDYILYGFTWVLSFAAAILDIVLKVQNDAFYNQPMVNLGWKIARDVVNMFYMVFLLIIAIATILGISSYSMKQLLWKLILSALLVNFSYSLSGVVIDTSNVLGNTFYSRMGTYDAQTGSRSLATTMVKGFQPQNMYQPGSASALTSKGVLNTIINIAIAYILGIILVLIASFVLFAAAFLLVLRIVSLWIIVILSPFAFLFIILPKTSSIAHKWFESLFNQAFFYPAYMFFLYIVFKAIDGRVIETFFSKGKAAGSVNFMNTLIKENVGTGSKLTETPYLVLSFVALAVFLCASLVVAKSMGAHGASAAISAGQSTRKWAQGKVAYGAQRTYEKVAGSAPARITLGQIPLVRRAVSSAVQKNAEAKAYRMKADVAKTRNLDPRSMAKIFPTLRPDAQAQKFKSMTENERKAMAKFSGPSSAKNIADNFVKHSSKMGMDRADAKKEAAAFVAQAGDTHEALKLFHEDMAQEGAANDMRDNKPDEYQKHLTDMMNSFTADQRGNVYTNEGATNKQVRDYLLKKEGNFDQFTKSREGIATMNGILKEVANDLGSEPEKISEALRDPTGKYNNSALADQFAANPGLRQNMWKTGEKLSEVQEKTRGVDEQLAIVHDKLNRENDLQKRAELHKERTRLENEKSNYQKEEARASKHIEGLRAKESAPRIGVTILNTPQDVPIERAGEKNKTEKDIEDLAALIRNQQNSGGGTKP
jgi:hypothetical protein